ncbi:polyprenyl glycosylphosphotransferase [Rhodococcus sp. ACS1]|uniref:sugar transferase n=1 Tax=Rhodococcus sp. ACS1 TaxID=2028570 RepID=UPI000BB0E327|nr:sugar transferase [Rhodococcus sp. ACS1]PBC51126.1 polyprenyl glycosylphosphotransferase [Rhodococcus sp. ACS1]
MATFNSTVERASVVHGVAAVPAQRGVARRRWLAVYLRRILLTDTLVVVAAVALAQWVRFGGYGPLVDSRTLSNVSYGLISVALVTSWLGILAVFHVRSPRVVGSGPEEYRRIATATLRLFGLIAIAALLLHVELARLYLAIAFPTGLLGLLLTRWMWRRVLARKRARGLCQTSVLVVGAEHSVRNLARTFDRGTADGYNVVGVCIPAHHRATEDTITVDGRRIPILGDEHDVVDAIERSGADTVAVTATEHLGHHGLREMVWDLEQLNVDMVVAPGMMDVSGPRLEMRPVAGLPLIHVEKPRYHGAKRFGKTSFDLIFAIVALVVVSPLMLFAAAAVKLTSRGPVFYKSERMGLDGKPFPMLKFRSMVDEADRHRATLSGPNEGAGVLFKLRDDPRVTRVGRVMRKFSIDELPQFINVLRREMSVVGPRPPLRVEVESYENEVHRRLLVRPGVTGLWQVSGRSDLSWEDSVRLDLSYVENWSMVGDMLIIAKTLKAVVRGDGAY